MQPRRKFFLALTLTCLVPAALASSSGSREEQALWQYYLDQLKPTNVINDFSTGVETQQSMADYMFMTLSQAYALITRLDPEKPEFFPYINLVWNLIGPNPDTTYYYAPVSERNSYRISGQRNTVSIVDFQPGYNWLGFAEVPGKSFAGFGIEDFEIRTDGSFEILYSSSRPEGYSGNWMQIQPGTDHILVRQVAVRPDEVDARLAIEKIDGPATAPLPRSFEQKMQTMVEYVKNSTAISLTLIRNLADNGSINQFEETDFGDIGGLDKQVYHQALYDVSLDEAIVITVKVPGQCRYWNVQTADRLFRTHEYMYAQSHLNGGAIGADSDGLTRLVLSHEDPGVANWVDLTGIEQGYMLLRWLGCSEKPDPKVVKVLFENLRPLLPPDTALTTPEERNAALRERALMRQLRRNW